jgi:endoglucanase
MFIPILAALLAAQTVAVPAYPPAPAAIPRTGPALSVGKCVNMANMLEPPTEGGWGGRKIVDRDFTDLKAAGFTTIRLPVSFHSHAAATAPFAIDPTFLARVHHVVDAATAVGLNVLIDNHNYDPLLDDPAAQTPRLAAIWRQVGQSFAHAPASVWFELMNEPHGKITDANLWDVLSPALAAVRESNPTRVVVIGGQNWSGIDSLATLTLPDDPNLVPTFHYYDPFPFTHQGANWVKPVPPLGRHFPLAEDVAALDANLAKVRAYIARTGRVPLMGEYGAYDGAGIPVAERVGYYRLVSRAFASAGIQGCTWGYVNTFRLRDGNRWIPGMVDAITTTTPAR